MATLPNPTNPWTYILYKFGFEVRCPNCFNFLTHPTLLPCNHIFCKRCVPICGENGASCATCQHQFMENETRRAYHMDNIVSIFKSMDATFGSNVAPFIIYGAQVPNQAPVVDQVVEKTGENAPQEKDKHTYDMTNVNRRTENSRHPIKAWSFSLTKLGHELTCPLCFKFLTKPTLLPCNHIYCYGCLPIAGQYGARCATCQNQFMDKEIRHGNHMDNIVSIYKSMSATFRCTGAPFISDGAQVPNQTPVGQVQEKIGGNTPTEINKHINAVNNVTGHHGRVDLVVALNSGAQIPKQTPVAQVQEETSVNTPKEKNKLANGEREAKKQKKLTNGHHTAVGHKYKMGVCAFCHSFRYWTGEYKPLLHIADGKIVSRDDAAYSMAIPVHQNCIFWAPNVRYDGGETVKDLESELERVYKIKCSGCGLKGAAVGCLEKSCSSIYHVPCALKTDGCRFNTDDYGMLCPLHKGVKFPSEKKSQTKKAMTGKKILALSTQKALEPMNFWATTNLIPREWAFCGSDLSEDEKKLLADFAALCGAAVYESWNPKVTHVIAGRDADGARLRTFEVLLASLRGKWVLDKEWVKYCVQVRRPVNEKPYEINLSSYREGSGTHGAGALDNASKTLFHGIHFYFSGEFAPKHKSILLSLIADGGGTLLENASQATGETNSPQVKMSTNLVVYNDDSQSTDVAVSVKRIAEADTLARSIGGSVIPDTWIVSSVTLCRVVPH